MTEPIFFEIPIYRTTIQNHSLEIEKTREKYYDKYPGLKEGEHFDNYKLVVEKICAHSWHYNEVIGFLRLYIFGSQLRVDYWFVTNKRIGKNIRDKKFMFCGKILEAQIDNDKSSKEIFEWIILELNDLEKREFKKRHFDLRTFKVLGRFVDWKLMCSQLNSWANPDFRKKYFEGTL